MARILPFPALRPPVGKAKQIAAPPYDVVTVAEAARMAAENPLGFLRIARAEIELPPDTSPYDDQVYRKASENYERLKREAPLLRDAQPSLYVYALEMDGRRQTGVVAAAAVDDYDAGVIKKHEKTRQETEDDRTRHILTLRSQTGPVFLTYRDSPAVNDLVEAIVTEPPELFDFVAHAGIRHSGWRVPPEATAAIVRAFAEVPALYIADGHHRVASASRARAALRDANPAHNGTEGYNGFLSVIFPAGQVRILPYNRVVRDLCGLTEAAFINRVSAAFDVTPADDSTPAAPGRIHMYLAGKWYSLRCTGRTENLSPVERLDVSLLQELVLAPILDIADVRTSDRIEFVGGIKGPEALRQRVDSGAAAVAFSMHPTTVEQLMAIADAGAVMPPKSTWFEPKLRDGLFVHDI